jgi:hypothetical protein
MAAGRRRSAAQVSLHTSAWFSNPYRHWNRSTSPFHPRAGIDLEIATI